MTVSIRLRKPQKDPIPRKPRGLASDVWVNLWIWTLDPRAGTADIRGYKKQILKPMRQIISLFNKTIKDEIPPYKIHPIWGKIKSEGSLKLTLKLMLVPSPPGGGGNLTPPTPPQPPPPPIAGN